MTLTIDEGPEMYGAAEKSGRILQIGSNGMSSKLQQTAREIIKSGKLGQITWSPRWIIMLTTARCSTRRR